MEGRKAAIVDRFLERFQGSAGGLVGIWAPFRLGLLGAHTDHQEGLVLGAALDHGTTLVARPREDSRVRAASEGFSVEVEFDLQEPPLPAGDWGDYLRGIATVAGRSAKLRRGLDVLVAADLHPGGIASSAALQVAFLMALRRVNDLPLDRERAMRMVVEAERAMAGVPVGLLDPAVILFGRERGLVFLDCRKGVPRTHTLARSAPAFELVVVDSGERRDLRTSPYARRVEECRSAARAAGATGPDAVLRDVDPERFRRLRARVDPLAARRAAHVFSENKRVRQGLAAAGRGDVAELGRLMTASGRSLLADFDCGTPATAGLLQLLLTTPGVWGATLAGGGFGGHLQVLGPPGTLEQVRESALPAYRERHPEHAGTCGAVGVGIGAGARVL